MPPGCTEPASLGLCGSLTSYCFSSPVPKHDTYSQRSSTDRSMSLTSGGSAPAGLGAGGGPLAVAGSAGGPVLLVLPSQPVAGLHEPHTLGKSARSAHNPPEHT